MRTGTLMMIAVAALFGLMAVFVTRAWLNSQAEARLREPERVAPIATQTIVVAARPLRFGEALTADALREVAWPGEALPPGAFARRDALLSSGKRIVLSPTETNEPILAVKVTGPGQRATLSALVGPGMKAVTIRVNDVEGVGGFVLPGDRVDVILTRQVDRDTASTHVLLQDVRVLAVDQMADERASDPVIPKAVTLEVDIRSGQKLGLAATIGTLSLLLRKAGETTQAEPSRVTMRDLLNDIVADNGSSTKVVVIRRTEKQTYRVPVEEAAQPNYARAEAE